MNISSVELINMNRSEENFGKSTRTGRYQISNRSHEEYSAIYTSQFVQEELKKKANCMDNSKLC